MITIDLIEALQKQMNLCEEISGYSCGVFVNSKKHMDIVRDVLSNIIERPNRDISLQAGSIPEAKWRNGSILKIIASNGNARGRRFSGLVIDNEIDKEIIDYQIMPMIIIPYNFKVDKDDNNINPSKNKLNVFTVGISLDDLDKSKQYKQIYISTGWRRNNLFIDEFTFANQKSFEKEYMSMWVGNDYDTPVVEKEVNNDKVLLYEAWGIPKDMITYETEFINKTKQTYLNIKGEFKNETFGFENDINVHLRIDTDVYDGYEVYVNDGLVTVILHEIINEAPVFKDCRAV